MKKALTALALVLVVVVLAAAGGFAWGTSAASARLEEKYETHRVDFPIPFPLSEAEIDALRSERAAAAAPADPKAAPADPKAAPADPLAGVDLAAIALERAIARGKHLIESRLACVECHGKDLGGGTMVDAPPIGQIYGVNITSGKGGVVAKYTAADWDRIVRHGVLPDGRPAAMPSADYFALADRELSDVVAFIKSVPPVDKDVPRPRLGPVGTMLMATREIRLSAEDLSDHRAAHRVEPPAAAVGPEFGRHLAQVCTGCHNPALTGGPIAGGDPSWPPAHNITLHADGIAGWTYQDFVGAMREGKRTDGTPLRPPMSGMAQYAAHLTETELKALWAYIETVPPAPSPE